jgi:hypothetical protein
MAWNGYFLYGGQEFINAERTEAYARNAGAGWFKGCFGGTDLAPMLGQRYDTPWLDPAPWTDPDAPESYGFWGAYPLGITGLEDSTRTGEVIESTSDGGTVGRIRHGTRAVVFNVALVGDSDCAVDYGARWLRRLLLGAACGTQANEACSGDDLCYLSCEPGLDWEGEGTLLDILGCLDPFERSLRRVVFNNGPTFTSKQTTTDGGAVWTASMTAVAGNPFIAPPAPTTVPLGCYVPPTNWKRRQFTIPEEFIPLWGEVVPKIEIHNPSATKPIRNLRIRFYADVDGDNDISDDICAYCGDIVVSYVPPGETLVLDGSDQLVYVDSPGAAGKRRADSLVFATDGTPFSWPVLSCGFGYIVTVDLPQTATMPSVDLSLFSRAA